MKLVDKLTSFILKHAKKVKAHSEDQDDLCNKAQKVEETAVKIKNAVSEGKKVTKEMADALKKRNRRLRGGKLL